MWYRPGSGVTSPQLLREVRPNYTAAAMRAKVQGVVLLECVVGPDGSIGEVNVVKSLDKVFGLDDEAVKAAKQWRFDPRPAVSAGTEATGAMFFATTGFTYEDARWAELRRARCSRRPASPTSRALEDTPV